MVIEVVALCAELQEGVGVTGGVRLRRRLVEVVGHRLRGHGGEGLGFSRARVLGKVKR